MRCPNCKKEILDSDVYCGHCGININEFLKQQQAEESVRIEQEELVKQEEENRIREIEEEDRINKEIEEYAVEVMIECEGNKLSAIKMLKAKYGLDTEEASSFVAKALKAIDNMTMVEEDHTASEDAIPTGTFNFDSIMPSKREKTFHLPTEIKYTQIVGSSSRKSTGSALARGAVGAFLIGPVGLVAAAGAKNKDTTTFLIVYYSGLKKTETVKNNSMKFNKYVKLLKQ